MKRLIKANDVQEIRNEIQRLEEALKKAEEKRSDLDELNSKVSELFNTVSDARDIQYNPDIVDAYDNAILDIKDEIQELKEELTKEENFGEYVALKWDDFLEKLKGEIMRIDNEFIKLGSKYDIPIPNNTLINKMVNFSKEVIKKYHFYDDCDVVEFCNRDFSNMDPLFGEYEYVCNLKTSWNIDIDESFELIIYDNLDFVPSSCCFSLDHKIIYTQDGIQDKKLFDLLPDEYQKKIIDFTNEFKQFYKRMDKEYSDFITHYFYPQYNR